MMAAWLSDNSIAHINRVSLHWAWLVLGWVTIRDFKSRSHCLHI